MSTNDRTPPRPPEAAVSQPAHGRPAYEPPRIVKKRSVSRATLASTFGGCGPDGCVGLTADG